MKHEYCINIWPRVRSCFLESSPSCEFFDRKTQLNQSELIMCCLFYSIFRLYSHSLLDQKINNVLSISNDQAVLMAIQSIIQNMLATEDPSQQQLHFLQSCGFGGLWRFAGPFTKPSVSCNTCSKNVSPFKIVEFLSISFSII